MLSLFGEKNLLIPNGSAFTLRRDFTEDQKRVYSCPLNKLLTPKTALRLNEKVKELLLLDYSRKDLKTDKLESFSDNAEARILIRFTPWGAEDEVDFQFKLAVRCTDDNTDWLMHARNNYEWDYDSVFVTRWNGNFFTGRNVFDGITTAKETIEETLDPKKLLNRFNNKLKSYRQGRVYSLKRETVLKRAFPGMFRSRIPQILSPGDEFNFGYRRVDAFKPVRWKVLEKKDGKALCTTLEPYSLQWDSYREENAEENITWQNSYLRKWFGWEFPALRGLFAESGAAARILPTDLSTKISLPDGRVIYENTTDRFFILSPEKEKEHAQTLASFDYSWAGHWQRTLTKSNNGISSDVICYSHRNPENPCQEERPIRYSAYARPCMVLASD